MCLDKTQGQIRKTHQILRGTFRNSRLSLQFQVSFLLRKEKIFTVVAIDLTRNPNFRLIQIFIYYFVEPPETRAISKYLFIINPNF